VPAEPPPSTAADLGLMDGAPPAPGALVTLANWQDPPFNRWGFQHVRELIPTARIERAAVPRPLPRAERDLAGVAFEAEGRTWTLGEALDVTYTDGFLVLHRGRIVSELYRNGLTPSGTHLLMSVSKSIVASVAGILAGRGVLDPEGAVTAVLPELAGTSWEGATVRHLLDMRAGTRFTEDYADPAADVRVYEQVYLWRPRIDAALPADGCTYMAGLANDRPHGGAFDYRSILTDMLGWVVERCGGARIAVLIARELWQPIGAEFDAEITVDGHGNALADGGVCATLRDLARFGLVWLERGAGVVPEAWIADTLAGGEDSREAFAGARYGAAYRGGFYRNKWWVMDPSVPFYAGHGINGQHVFVHPPAELVVAKLSTWPTADDAALDRITDAAVRALAAELSAG
jgi:CubicO group peptidase (beta-lactamase class C family)